MSDLTDLVDIYTEHNEEFEGGKKAAKRVSDLF